jgi:hypothetical protein
MKKYFFILSVLLISCGSSQNIPATTSAIENNSVIEVATTATETTIAEPPLETVVVTEVLASIETISPPVFDHTLWDRLLQKYVNEKGNVNYKGFLKNKEQLTLYLNQLATNTVKDSWSKEDKLAYWINAYNAYTVKLILDNYPLKSIKDIKDPWDVRFIKIGEKWMTLNDIEHNILRKMEEPRIHFAIVCASVSCPKLSNKAFTAENLEQQLSLATTSFLADASRNTITPTELKLSKIFRWFAKDFKQDGDIISFIKAYTKVDILENAKISFEDYDWNLNE